MRYGVLVSLCLFAAACGGDFSNDDLEFLNALPQREDLTAKLPEGQQRSGGGLETRADRLEALALGDVSQLAVDTLRTGTEFNRSVDSLLRLLEDIRRLPPSEREPDRRVWGPFPDEENPGNEARFVMEREVGRFDYRLEYRPTGANETQWWAFLTGSFKADAGIRKGEGTLALDVKQARDKGFPTGELDVYERLDIRYQTKAPPLQVELVFTGRGPGASQLRYRYRELPQGLREMKFRVPDTNLVPGGLLETLELTSRWATDNRGVSVLDVLSGDVPGAKYTECWSAQARVTFISRNWDLLKPYDGDPASCANVSGLDG